MYICNIYYMYVHEYIVDFSSFIDVVIKITSCHYHLITANAFGNKQKSFHWY